jgi:hypothetical protein
MKKLMFLAILVGLTEISCSPTHIPANRFQVIGVGRNVRIYQKNIVTPLVVEINVSNQNNLILPKDQEEK